MKQERHYPELTEHERRLLLNILRSDSRVEDSVLLNKRFWTYLKHYYWQLEDNPDTNREDLASIIVLIDSIDPRRCDKVSDAVSKPTLRYLKRKARRFVKRIATSNPELYVYITEQLLLSLATKSDERNLSNIDAAKQPVPLVDNNQEFASKAKRHYNYFREGILDDLRFRYVLGYIMLGDSEHAQQLNNGNGSIVLNFWTFRNKEAGMPNQDIWTKFGEQVATLHSDKALPWYALDFLMRVQHLNNKSLHFDKGDSDTLRIAFLSPSGRLQKEAMDVFCERIKQAVTNEKRSLLSRIFSPGQKDDVIEVDVLAYAYPKLPAKFRKLVDEKVLPAIMEQSEWSKEFFNTLVGMVYFRYKDQSQYPINTKLKSCVQTIEKSGNSKQLLNFNARKSLAYLLLSAGSEQLQVEVLDSLRSLDLRELVHTWYGKIDHTNKLQREFYISLFAKKFRKMDWEAKQMLYTVLRHEDDELTALSWQIVSESAKKLRGYWDLNGVWSVITTKYNEGSDAFEKWLTISPSILEGIRTTIKISNVGHLKNYASEDLLKKFGEDKEIQNTLQAIVKKQFKNSTVECLSLLYVFPDDISKRVLLEKNMDILIQMFSTYRWQLNGYIYAWFNALKESSDMVWRLFEELLSRSPISDLMVSRLLEAIVRDENREVALRWFNLYFDDTKPEVNKKKDFITQSIWRLIKDDLQEHTASILSVIDDEVISEVLAFPEINELIDWIVELDNESWQEAGSIIAKVIARNDNQLEIWKQILENYIDSARRDVYEDRFWNSSEFKELFLAIQDIDLLEINHVAVEDILCEWINTQRPFVASDQQNVYKTIAHRLPKIRSIGWELLKDMTPDMVFMLQLAECGIPEVLTRSIEWFEAIPLGDVLESEAILALCDSPKNEVRQQGMDMITNRKEALNYSNSQLLPCLSEHPDQYVQQRVAESLEQLEAAGDYIQRFDKEVMRQKNVARKAKESIKRRLDYQDNVDVDLLITIARGNDKQDAEWAILKLTQLALADKVSNTVFSLI